MELEIDRQVGVTSGDAAGVLDCCGEERAELEAKLLTYWSKLPLSPMVVNPGQ